MSEAQLENEVASAGTVDQLARAAALCGGCVVLAAGALIVSSILARRFLSVSIPGDVELVQAATALGAFAFLPFGQLSRSNIVVDTFTKRLPDKVCRRIDAFWDLSYAAVTLVLGWRLGVGAIDALRSHTISAVLGLPIGVFMLVSTILLFVLAAAAVVTMNRLLQRPE
jgi:TRAP-type C4-dicarboxylate transport system permease small subunit